VLLYAHNNNIIDHKCTVAVTIVGEGRDSTIMLLPWYYTPPLSPSYLPFLGMIEKENKGGELGMLYHVLEEGAIYRIYMYAHTHTHIQYMCVIYIFSTHCSLSITLSHYCVYFSSPPSSSPSCSLIQSVRLSLSNCMMSVLSL